MEALLSARDWAPLIGNFDVIINCVGILRQQGPATYARVHHQSLGCLAEAARTAQVRLIHVSALGLRESDKSFPRESKFLTSKLHGENVLRASGADWRIVRPSLLDGEGGYGAKWIRRITHWPIVYLPADATGTIAALDVGDLGEAIATLARKEIESTTLDSEREFDCGGPHTQTLEALVAAMRRVHTLRPAMQIRIPALLARIASHVCDLLHVTPYSYGHYQLLRRDNCPRHNRLPELLCRVPRAIGLNTKKIHNTSPTQWPVEP